jgi:hypothetical protein
MTCTHENRHPEPGANRSGCKTKPPERVPELVPGLACDSVGRWTSCPLEGRRLQITGSRSAHSRVARPAALGPVRSRLLALRAQPLPARGSGAALPPHWRAIHRCLSLYAFAHAARRGDRLRLAVLPLPVVLRRPTLRLRRHPSALPRAPRDSVGARRVHPQFPPRHERTSSGPLPLPEHRTTRAHECAERPDLVRPSMRPQPRSTRGELAVARVAALCATNPRPSGRQTPRPRSQPYIYARSRRAWAAARRIPTARPTAAPGLLLSLRQRAHARRKPELRQANCYLRPALRERARRRTRSTDLPATRLSRPRLRHA